MTFGATPLATAHVAGATGGTTSAVDTTGAKLIVIHAGFSGTPTISDSKGNTWTAGTLVSTSPATQFFYCINPTVGTGHTFTIAASVGAIAVTAWSATGSPALDSQSTGNAVSNVTSSQFGSTTFTPTTSGCLCIAGAAFGSPGFTSGFTPGSGWSLGDVQNYVPGTNYGASQVYKIQTTATAIPNSEVTSSWTGAVPVAFIGIAFKEGASAALTVTTPVAFEVHQRSGTTGSIQITGTVSGAAEDIEASFNGGAYQTIATAVAAGNYSGTLTGQAQGQGTLTVRKKTTTSATASVANVGIGDVFADGGDSRDDGRGTNGQVYTHATLKACMFKSGAWAELTESAGAGTHLPLLATQIMASQGVPVAFIRCGAGGTDVAGSNNTWAKPGGQYSALTTAVANSTVSAVKAALFMLGPNAIVNSNNAAIPLATYRTALDTLASNLAADVPGAPKLFIDVCGEVGTGSPPDRRTAQDNIRGADLSAWNNNSAAIKPGPVLIDQDYADNVHPSTDAQLKQVADRLWPSMAEQLYGGAAGSGRGPRVVSATWNIARTQITVVFDRTLKTGLTHATQAWAVKDNGSAMTISSVAYHGSNVSALVLTMSAAATGAAGTTTMSFASGDDAVGRVVPLSTDVALPAGGVVNLPAEPIYGYTVAENAALATTVTVTLTTDGSTPAAGLTGLRWAFFDQAVPNSMVAPVAKGTGGSTNGSGVFTASISGTALAVGSTGWLVVTNSDGTVGQAGGCKGFSGPVQVS